MTIVSVQCKLETPKLPVQQVELASVFSLNRSMLPGVNMVSPVHISGTVQATYISIILKEKDSSCYTYLIIFRGFAKNAIWPRQCL